jgi:Glyoxalase-like domain
MTGHVHDVGGAPTLGSINLEADDPAALAAFWAEITGGAPSRGPGGAVYLPPGSRGGFAMFFQPRTAPRPEHVPMHLDLTVPWGSRESWVGRLVEAGAQHRWDVLDEVPWVRWSTLADPEGNLFCVAEHPPAVEG